MVVVARGLLLAGSKEVAQSLLDAIDKNELSLIGTISDRDIRSRHDKESVLSLQLANELEQSIAVGFGIVATENRSGVLCQTMTDSPKAHQHLIESKRDRLEYEFQSSPTVQSTSTELAFISMQRGECRAVYGSAQNLKTLVEAMKRVKMKFHVLPIWFSSKDLAAAAEAVAKIEDACAKWRYDLAQKRKDDAAIEAKRQAQSEAEREAHQSVLQKQNGAQARALEKSIVSEIKSFVELPSEKHVGVRQKYPAFVNWYQRMLSDGWELVKVDGMLKDYGVAEWKGRVLEAGFVDARLNMQHRQLGEYRDACYTVGYTLDKEFDIAREPLVISCSDEAALTRYKQGARFSSLWILTPRGSTGGEAGVIETALPEPMDCRN